MNWDLKAQMKWTRIIHNLMQHIHHITASREQRRLQLLELEEMRLTAYESSKLYKDKVKKYHDKKLLKKDFQLGQQVLLFNSRLKLFPGKLKSKWSEPYTIKKV